MEKALKNILVPLNFSNSSDQAIHTAIAMCKRHDAALHILQVNKENDFPYPTGKNALLIGMRVQSRVAELRSLESLAKQIEKSEQIKCFYHLEEGPFTQTVTETAGNFYCDLLIVQKKADSSTFSFSFKRDICKLLIPSSCPVMVVPGNCHNNQFKSILFPVWVKRPILNKLHAAIPIIDKNESDVVLFGSVRSTSDVWEMITVNKLIKSIGLLISLSAKNIRSEVDEKPGTAKSILKKAADCNSDLIVISGHSKRGFNSPFRQSYTRFIINHSKVPVLSVN